MAANGSNQAILSRALTPEERQRLRDQNNPYRLSSMSWADWSRQCSATSLAETDRKVPCSKDLHSHKVQWRI
eukprot:Skav201364  [mRNA]  locus=scaffold2471:196438:197411:+ [translate_table: standard]